MISRRAQIVAVVYNNPFGILGPLDCMVLPADVVGKALQTHQENTLDFVDQWIYCKFGRKYHWPSFPAASTRIRLKLMIVSSEFFIVIQNNGERLSHMTATCMFLNTHIPPFLEVRSWQ